VLFTELPRRGLLGNSELPVYGILGNLVSPVLDVALILLPTVTHSWVGFSSAKP
jgi:hypothetical protein